MNTFTAQRHENSNVEQIKIDSMKTSTSKVAKSTFSNEWANPSGGTTYYYDLEMENGDSGSIGVTEQNSEKVKEGAEITYNLIGNKFKNVKMSDGSTGSNAKQSKSGSGGGRKNNSYGVPTQESMLGYCWGYAKDLIIAGKTMDDVEELNKVARYIYGQVGAMLNGDLDDTPF